MRLTSIALLSLMIAVLVAPRVHADLRLTMRDGRVVIVAKDASIAEILAEWGRIGHTAIINADQLPGEPITLELQNVGEADALAVLLRAAPAYLVLSRAATDPSASLFERIVIVKLSAVQPMPEASAVRVPVTSAGVMPIAPLELRPVAADAADSANDANASQPLSVAVAPDPEEMRNTEAAQSLHATRRALEVADPRNFHLPTPPRSPGPGSPTVKRP
jgi:hypothetical protein